MTIPLDRIAAICPQEWRSELFLLSNRQAARIRAQIRSAITTAKRRKVGQVDRRAVMRGWLKRMNGKPIKLGRPITSEHPRAAYWREYKRRKAMAKLASSTSPLTSNPDQ